MKYASSGDKSSVAPAQTSAARMTAESAAARRPPASAGADERRLDANGERRGLQAARERQPEAQPHEQRKRAGAEGEEHRLPPPPPLPLQPRRRQQHLAAQGAHGGVGLPVHLRKELFVHVLSSHGVFPRRRCHTTAAALPFPVHAQISTSPSSLRSFSRASRKRHLTRAGLVSSAAAICA